MQTMLLLFLLRSVLLTEWQYLIHSSATLTKSVRGWCHKWGMCLNISKTKTISRSRIMLPCFPELTLNDIALKETSEVIILGVTYEPKLTCERHVRSVASSASQTIVL